MQEVYENKYARLSLISITLTMAITTIHHVFRLGFGFLIPAVILTIIPYALMRWYAYSKNTAILKSYSLFNVLMFIWFGFIDGFMDHVLKALGLQNSTFLPGGEAAVVKTVLSLWSPEAGNIFYESTGVLTFIIGVIAMGYLIRMILFKHASEKAGPLEITQS